MSFPGLSTLSGINPVRRCLVSLAVIGLGLALPAIFAISGSQAGFGAPQPGVTTVRAMELPASLWASPQQRFGFAIARTPLQAFNTLDIERLHAGWHTFYGVLLHPPHLADTEHIQMIRTTDDAYDPATITETLGPIVDANPGSLWLVGNEPDRAEYQDDHLPVEYAEIYHTVYTFLKRRDPTCQVAVGGIVQPTPLRLTYLNQVLLHYQGLYGEPMPVDVWNIHNMILREEQGGWGAGIPPGSSDLTGRLYEIDDHDNMTIFRQHILDFRAWMAAHGERNKPLIVSEYGILMPEMYGFDVTRVTAFMNATFDFFLTTTDEALGYPADGNRLVQRWAWYSLNEVPYNPETGVGYNGNLFDPDTMQITPFGEAYAAYTAPDLALRAIHFSPPALLPGQEGAPIRIEVQLVNQGVETVEQAVVRLWDGDPNAGGIQLGNDQSISWLTGRAEETYTVEVMWNAPTRQNHAVYAIVDPDDGVEETAENNNTLHHTLLAATDQIFLPLITR